ncbi:hypothetical protein AB0N05_33975 [Nocardia sp. NPDC051030]|uniref:DUF7373 family lipoprotein n=1 Tax=Nocardia sp. NPDC051030 TaxID=3155162 RepID=UPI00341FA173
MIVARTRTLISTVALAVVCVLASGCTTAGHPSETHVDLSKLDVGDYSTEPMNAPSAPDGKYGKLIESVRMGEAMIDPVLADPAAKYSLSVGVAALPTSDYVTRRLGDAVKSVLDQQRMVAGFWVGGTDTEGRAAQVGKMHRLSVTLLRFPDDATAKAAADGIDAADFAVSPDNVAVTVPGYAAARGHWRPTVPTMAATLAHGSFVVSVLTELPSTDLPALSDIAAKTFAAQLPALDKFQPTPVDGLAGLALDRDGMLRRALPAKRGEWPFPTQSTVPVNSIANWDDPIVDSGIVYGPQVIHLKYARPESAKLAPAEAFAKVSFFGVMRFPDAKSARKYYGPPKVLAENYREADGPAGVPDIRCDEDTTSKVSQQRFFCFVLYHRYVGYVASDELKDAQRKAAAQYALLVKTDD